MFHGNKPLAGHYGLYQGSVELEQPSIVGRVLELDVSSGLLERCDGGGQYANHTPCLRSDQRILIENHREG